LQTTQKPARAVDQKASWRDRANAELEKIVALFSSKELPDLCAKALISAPEKPSSKWSLGNQLLMLLAGTSDARGYRQWTDVGRWVGMNKKAIWILGPVRKKVKLEAPEDGDAQGGQTKDVLIGFKAIPVFRYEDTAGQELPVFQPRDPPPLMDVAGKFGMSVQYARLGPGMYGATDHSAKTIVLASEDWDVFFHELAHAIHRSFEPKSGHGQEPEAETIAQLVAATLARLYGRPADGFSWSYISMYAQSSSPQQVGRLCMRVLDRTKKVLELVYPDRPDPPAGAPPPDPDQPVGGNPYQDRTGSGGQGHGT
jgi:hypothetical protein